MSPRCLIVSALLISGSVLAQTVPPSGLRENSPNVYAFTNARIVVSPGRTIERGTLVVRDGLVENVGASVLPPPDARLMNMEGRTMYPGLIELYSDVGLPKPPQPQGEAPQQPAPPERPRGAVHWNARVRAEHDVLSEFTPDAKAAEKLRSQGFTLAVVAPQKGIFRGASALIHLGEGAGADVVVKPGIAQHVAFDQRQGFGAGYPNSLMGSIALIRQTWYDADWYRKAQEAYARDPAGKKRPETNAALAALREALAKRQPVVMDVSSDLDALRAAKVSKEFALKTWLMGSGYEYRRLQAIKAAGLPIIVPLNFPETPSLEAPEDALQVPLEDLRHWDAAPENLGRLQKAGVPFTITSAQLKDQATFLAQMRKAIARGLSAEAALAALTTTPAAWLGLEDQFGTLERGKVANIVVTDGNLFAEKTKIQEVWIEGKMYDVKSPPRVDARGVWDVSLALEPTETATLTLRGEPDKPTGTLSLKGKELKLPSVTYSNQRLALSLPGDSAGFPGTIRMSAVVGEKDLFGVGELPNGKVFSWSGIRKGPAKPEPDTTKSKEIIMASFPDVFPPGEFGRARQPDQPEQVFVKNATIWTEGSQGILEKADMLVSKGKILRIGKNLNVPAGAVVIDATAKHVTPGLIDAHSHTALSSVNESGQAISAETRCEDVIDPDDIWIYRQLAGGLTAANLLHGSANPIGGQNAVVKWRWGGLAEDLLLRGAPPGIKFALGENVKQSNSTRPTSRYPQTRMGVEQIIRDEFKAALDYEKGWHEWERDKTAMPPRKDLELDAILEILKGKRLVHSHCYRQDEILMLIRVADDFGFKIASFQHVLEGYKVADAIARHGAGASSFSDWWAYKIEAFDAIPGNGPLMQSQGVVVSYNSDDAQLATRMNWEATKAVRFGVSKGEALKFVTINPARQLRVDDRIGSLEAGKDADFVVWNGDPLSTRTKCEQTWVDGRKYFDVDDDRRMREEIQKERSALIQKAIASKKEPPGSTEGSRAPMRRPNEEKPYSCMEDSNNEN